MGWHSRDESERADYDRDCKRDAPDYPGGDFEGPPARLAPKVTPALETAIAVRGLKSPEAGADLIEQFARTYQSGERLGVSDLDMMIAVAPQRCAAAKLVGYCEGLAGSATLPLETETQLRRLIAETLSAFGMSAADRNERVQA